VICHQCDFAGCANPGHMRLGTNATNRVEYFARRRNLANPLPDVRGAAGRTRAVAAASEPASMRLTACATRIPMRPTGTNRSGGGGKWEVALVITAARHQS